MKICDSHIEVSLAGKATNLWSLSCFPATIRFVLEFFWVERLKQQQCNSHESRRRATFIYLKHLSFSPSLFLLLLLYACLSTELFSCCLLLLLFSIILKAALWFFWLVTFFPLKAQNDASASALFLSLSFLHFPLPSSLTLLLSPITLFLFLLPSLFLLSLSLCVTSTMMTVERRRWKQWEGKSFVRTNEGTKSRFYLSFFLSFSLSLEPDWKVFWLTIDRTKEGKKVGKKRRQ